MDKTKVLAALDAAFAAELASLFAVLVANLIEGRAADAQSAFARGLNLALTAHSIAEHEIDRVFALES